MEEEHEAQLVAKTRRLRLEGPGTFWLLIIFVLMLLALSLIIFGDSGGDEIVSTSSTPTSSENPQSRTYTIFYKNGVFSPTNLRIHAGDTVRFKNESILPLHIISDPHPEHSGLSGFDSIGDVPQNSYYIFTFATKGEFGYHNERNLNEAGTVIVR